MWINWALSWAEAKEPNYHRLFMFFYVLQIYPTRGAYPDFEEKPNDAEMIDIIRRVWRMLLRIKRFWIVPSKLGPW